MAVEYSTFVPERPAVFMDRSGVRYGRLVAVRPVVNPADKRGVRVWWECRCDCGSTAVVPGGNLGKKTNSCGCVRSNHSDKSTRLRGLSKSRTYRVWRLMRARCDNPNLPNYRHYGGRGITYDPRWRSFENFYADMGPSPDGMCIDRKDNDGHYTKGNCRWVTPTVNNNNKRNNVVVEFDGEKITVPDLATKLGVPRARLYSRLKRGWSIEEAAAKPIWGRAHGQ